MARFFIEREQVCEGIVTVLGEDAHHISRSLRMASGEEITVCDSDGMEYRCELTGFLPDRVLGRVLETKPSLAEPPFFCHVYQALPKGEKLDSVIQKAVECGACEVTTFESERCVVRAKAEQEEKKVERRRRIALEAAKQSGRGRVPKVHPTCSFREALSRAATAELALFCYEGEGTLSLPHVLRAAQERGICRPGMTVSVMVGSEGGFSPREAEAAEAAGMHLVGLGPRILRTETASSFVLSCLVYALELEAQ